MEPEEAVYTGRITDRIRDLIFNVYPGRDGNILLYDDDGEGYGYEEGKYITIRLTYSEEDHTVRAETEHAYDADWQEPVITSEQIRLKGDIL